MSCATCHDEKIIRCPECMADLNGRKEELAARNPNLAKALGNDMSDDREREVEVLAGELYRIDQLMTLMPIDEWELVAKVLGSYEYDNTFSRTKRKSSTCTDPKCAEVRRQRDMLIRDLREEHEARMYNRCHGTRCETCKFLASLKGDDCV